MDPLAGSQPAEANPCPAGEKRPNGSGATSGVRRHLEGAPALTALVAFALAVAYWPALVSSYAYSDDYPHVAPPESLFGQSWSEGFQDWTEQGRPLMGLTVETLFSTVSTISDLRFIRLASVVGIFLLGLVLHRALVRYGLRPGQATAVVILLLTLPAYQVYAAWAVLAFASYAAVLGGIAGAVAIQALSTRTGRALLARLALAAAILTAALLTYQPAAMVFWVVVAAALFVPRRPPEARLLVGSLAVAGAAIVVAGPVFKVAIELAGWEFSGRSTLVHDMSDKVSWFTHVALPRALNLHHFSQFRSAPLAAAVAATILVGIVLRTRANPRDAVRLTAIGILLVPLAYLPSLVVEENWASYRSQGAVSMLVGLYFALAVIEILGYLIAFLRRFGPRVDHGARVAVTAVVVAALGLVVIGARENVRSRFVLPEMRELAMIRDQVETIPGRTVSRVAFLQPPMQEPGASGVDFDEFAFPSSAARWVPEPAVALVLREQRRLGDSLRVEVVPPGDPVPEGMPLVDMSRFRDGR